VYKSHQEFGKLVDKKVSIIRDYRRTTNPKCAASETSGWEEMLLDESITCVKPTRQCEEAWKRRRYDEPFKRNAVKVLLESGKPMTTIAQSFGIDHSILHRWKKKFADEFVPQSTNLPGKVVSRKEFIDLKRNFESLRDTVDNLRIIVEKAFSRRYGA
jgi:transposase-like protein